jgi:hypothetical protein
MINKLNNFEIIYSYDMIIKYFILFTLSHLSDNEDEESKYKNL